jgi:hypothetical protein
MKRNNLTASLLAALAIVFASEAKSQEILFDFDNAPLHSPFPVDVTAGGITAHLSANPSYYNYSIQWANVLGFTPSGFSGFCIYPSTIYLCDLLISFSRPLSDASILYAPEEYDTDTSCLMRITGYLGSTFVATNTYRILTPGTWPTGTLSLHSAQPFDNVVIHYESPPPTGGDWGPIFMADNLRVTPAPLPALQMISAASRKTHGGSASFDVDLPLAGAAGVEPRSGGSSGTHVIVFTFSNNIALADVAVSSGSANMAGAPAIAANSVIVTLIDVLDAQTITLTLSNVSDTFGQALPETVVSADFLLGDVNGDRVVNTGDTLQTRTRSGQAADGSNFRSDVNVDGTINSGDGLIVRAASGHGIP